MESSIYDSLMNEEEENFFDLIDNEKEEEINNLLSKDTIIEIWNYRNKENENSTILHISVYKKNLSITEKFLKYIKEKNPKGLGDFINAQNKLGVTALHYASFNGDLKIIKLLINYGANVEKISKKKLNVIHYSAQGNKPSSLMYFYLRFKEKDIKENTRLIDLIKNEDMGGSTALHWAVYSSAEDFLLFLLNLDIFVNDDEKQEFIDKRDKQGYTALHLCAISKSSRIALKLLQNGATPYLKDHLQKTPCQLAIEKNQVEIARIIQNSQSCQLCNFKAPVKQIKKSKKNIILIFIFQLITNFIMFVSILPFLYDHNKVENKIILNRIFGIYIFLLFLFCLFYLSLLFKDPGVLKSGNISTLENLIEENKDLAKYCYKCFILKNKYSKHCFICNKCYEDFDHHCFWINKCVAKNNYQLFISFLIITFLFLFFVLYCCTLTLIGFFYNNYSFEETLKIYSIEKIKSIFKDNFKMINLILNILLILIDLIFLIPEFILLILHLKICCWNMNRNKNRKINKRNESNTTESYQSGQDMSLLDN